MRTVCRRCKTTGPRSDSLDGASAGVRAEGWRHFHSGWYCARCEPLQRQQRPGRAMFTVVVFFALAAIASTILTETLGWWR